MGGGDPRVHIRKLELDVGPGLEPRGDAMWLPKQCLSCAEFPPVVSALCELSGSRLSATGAARVVCEDRDFSRVAFPSAPA